MPVKTTKTESNNFLVQGAILAIAGILVRLIGLAYRVPLLRIIGSKGMGYYSTAYNLYAIILLLSSYSLPLAVSKMVSSRIAKNEYKNANKILRAALIYATIVGGLGFVIVFFGANFFASNLYQMPLAKYALQSLAPTIWIMAYLGVLRGYFQGHSTMVPTALSQIFEQIINAAVSVGAAYYLCEVALKQAKGEDVKAAYGAAGGTIGTGAGTVIALLVMLAFFFVTANVRRKNILNDKTLRKESFSTITRVLILTVIPVIASTAIYNINSVATSRAFFLQLNFDNALLTDKNIRSAIAMAIDKEGFVNVLLGGHGKVANGPFPMKDSENPTYSFSPEKSKELLANAGWSDSDNDGYVDKDGKNLELNYITYPGRTELPILAQSIQANLKDIGIKLNINSTENYLEVMKDSTTWDIFGSAMVTNPTGNKGYFFDMTSLTESPKNRGHYSNTKLDELAKTLSTTFENEKREEIAKKMSDILVDDCGFIFVSHLQMSLVSKKNIKGLTPMPSDYYEFSKDLVIE